MLNQAILVGRIANIISNDIDSGKILLELAISRSYKNKDGMYDTDFVDVTLNNSLAETTNNYCRKGDIVGVKGRIETIINEENIKKTCIVAEKVTFLSSNNVEKED